MQFLLILIVAILTGILPATAYSQSEGEKYIFDDSQPYVCFQGSKTDGKIIFGIINPKNGKFSALNTSAKLQKKIDAINKKLNKLSSNLSGKNSKVEELKKSLKLLKKGPKACKKMTSIPVASPTATPTPEVQPTVPSGPLSGDAFSLNAYHSDTLTEAECKHLLRKVAFGGSKELLTKCEEQGLGAVVDVLTAAESTVENETTPKIFTHFYNDKFANSEYLNPAENNKKENFYLVGQSPSTQLFEDTILPRLVKGSPLKERLTYELMDWFAVDTEAPTCSNTSGSLHENCIYPYYNLYRNTALNFGNEPLAGTFEHLLQRQVYDVAMQFWLNNTNNCNINSQSANENFGRELMELFALGTHDLRAVKTYENNSVIAAAQAASGYTTTWNGTETQFNYYSCPNFKNSKTLFSDSPWGAAATVTINNGDQTQHYPELVRGIIYKHPQSPIYIAGQLFSRLIHQSLGANEKTDLLLAQASDLMMNKYKYHIGKYIRDILKSQAMFSKESFRSAIATPTDTFVRFMRLLEVPVIDRGIFVSYNWVECTTNNKNSSHPDYDPICKDSRFILNNKQMRIEKNGNGKLSARSEYVATVPDVAVFARYALLASGDLPGQPASVFGRSAGTAGKWRGSQVSQGHEALTTQYLLERINGLSNILFVANAANIITDIDHKYAMKDSQESPYLLIDKFQLSGKSQTEIVKLFEELFDVPLSDAERQVMVGYLGSDYAALDQPDQEVRIRGLILLFYHNGISLLS